MKAVELLLVIATLAILAEVTYLVVKLPRQNLSRKQSRPILVDTSVLIDGRIIAVAQSGFIGDTLVIPRSVIGELQFLADNADHDKRARARYGLDVVKELQSMPHLKVEILQDGSKAEEGVDERLLSLAKKHNAAVCTIDYNLNKVAVVEGITVLNVNELAQSLRMAYLPGEKMLLELVQKGQDAHQGVGYLTDGTMVVVEHANKNIGQTIEIEFIRSLQTAAGKMMFARPVERQQPQQPKAPKPQGKRPIAAVQQKVEATPAEAPKKPVKTVYHSDPKERRFEKKNSTPQKPAHTNEAKRPARSPKPRTSVQREAALIDLVEKQK
jgi:rRNA-processing protein FCF1